MATKKPKADKRAEMPDPLAEKDLVGQAAEAPAEPTKIVVYNPIEAGLDAMLADQAAKAAALYDSITTAIAGREVQSWAMVLKRRDAGEFELEAARDFYHAQPVLKELTDNKVLDSWEGGEQLSGVLAAKDRATYIANESTVNSSTWAILHNGHWAERGRMGWWGLSDATDGGTLDYAHNFWLTLRSLKPGEQVTVVDCHI